MYFPYVQCRSSRCGLRTAKGESQSLIPFMAYFEARYQDRMSLFVDVMYANITAGESANRNFRVSRFVGGSIAARASVDYEQLTVQFGGAYEFARLGRDRSGEGPRMAGVGETPAGPG